METPRPGVLSWLHIALLRRAKGMFTGIIQHVGTVASARHGAESAVLSVDVGPVAEDAAVGDSICISGACLTATAVSGTVVDFDVSAETLRLTALGQLRQGSRVNVEPSLRIGDKLGGHFVSGHVDGVGTIRKLSELPGEVRLAVDADPRLAAHMILKGSVAVDGVSLTIAALDEGSFECSLIPETMRGTTMQFHRPGAHVNVECDMIGRWVRKLLSAQTGGAYGGLSLDDLREQGW
jgi:riboflavin synthase